MLVLGTYRAEEIDTARGLRQLLTSLRRAGQALEVAPTRLEPEAVAELAAGMLGSEAPGELLTLLNARAGGPPLSGTLPLPLVVALRSGAMLRIVSGAAFRF